MGVAVGAPPAAAREVGTEPGSAGSVRGAQDTSTITVTMLPDLGDASAQPRDINEAGRIVGDSWSGSFFHSVVWDDGDVTDLTPDIPAESASLVTDITDSGWVSGTIQGDVWRWRNGQRTDLPLPATTEFVDDVNNRGDLLFTSIELFVTGQAYVWRRDTLIPAPDVEGAEGQGFFGNDMNNAGVVAGGIAPNMEPGPSTAPYVWEVGRAPLPLDLPDGGIRGEAQFINERGDVVVGSVIFSEGDDPVSRVVRWRHGRPTGLGTLGGTSTTLPGDPEDSVNSWGHIVGLSRNEAGKARAFLWRNGRMTNLGTLEGDESSWAEGVNDWGQVIGLSWANSFEFRSFLWQAGRMLDLSEVVGDDSFVAVDINNRGQIIGYVQPSPTGPWQAMLVDVPVLWAS